MILSDFRRAVELFVTILQGRSVFGKEILIDLKQSLNPAIFTFLIIYGINIALFIILKFTLKIYSARYTNIGYLEGSYNLILTILIYLNKSMLNIANIIGWIIALIQLFIDKKYVNLIAMIIPIIFTTFTAIDKYNSDKETIQNSKKCYKVEREQAIIDIASRKITQGDIIQMFPNDIFPCIQGQLLNHASFDKYSVNGQYGTFQPYTKGSLIYQNQILLWTSQNYARIKILKVKGNGLNSEINQLEIEKTYSAWTICSLVLLIVLCLDVQVSDFAYCISQNFIWSKSFILLIGVLIALNGVMPVMKIVLNINFFNMLIKKQDEIQGVHSRKTLIKGKGQLDITDMDNMFIFSDKTGTLTQGRLKVNQLNFEHHLIRLLASKLKVWKINNELFSTSSLEQIRLATYLNENYKIEFPIWSGNENGSFNYTFFEQSQQIQVQHSTFELGSHTLIKLDHKNYYVVMYQRQVFEKYIGLSHPKNSLRALCMIYKQTNLSLQQQKTKYLECLNSQIQLSGFKMLAEIYFEDPLRKGSTSGAQKLISKKMKFWMLTGDSVTTAKQISSQLYNKNQFKIVKSIKELKNIMGEEIPVISGLIFQKFNTDQKNQFARQILRFQCGVMAQFKAKYKKQIVQLTKQFSNSIVTMLGDANNDYEALKIAHLSFVQKQGSKLCKNFSHVIIHDANSAYEYLFTRRRYHLYGRWLFCYLFMMYNYIMGIICIVGLHAKNFELKGILFVEPWRPLHSLAASFSLLIIIIIICRFTAISRPLNKFLKAKHRYSQKKFFLLMLTAVIPTWIIAYKIKHSYSKQYYESVCIQMGILIWIVHTILSMILL